MSLLRQHSATAINIDSIELPKVPTPAAQTAAIFPRMSRFDLALGAVILTLIGVIFVFDILTPADHVSVCFLYAIPIFVTIAGQNQPIYAYAALATALSALGSFIQPPEDQFLVTFYANRAIAVAALWSAAALIITHKKAEMLVRHGFEEEKRKAEGRARFLDVLSHEIGTSLTTIDGHAFRLKRLAESPSPPDVAARADKIHNAVTHIKTMVQRVQLASEAGEPNLHARREPLDLRALVTDTVQQARAVNADRVIETDLDGLPAVIGGDAYMLRQVVDNLLSNATKYSPPTTPILIRGYTEGANAVLSMSDAGRGIPDDEQTRLFEPYYRARNSRGVHGAGIGLYVCERFISSHGGTIEITSRLGAGTNVTVRLPITANLPDTGHAAIANSVH